MRKSSFSWGHLGPFKLTVASPDVSAPTLTKAGILDFAVLCADDLKGQEDTKWSRALPSTRVRGWGSGAGRWGQGRKELGNKELPEPQHRGWFCYKPGPVVCAHMRWGPLQSLSSNRAYCHLLSAFSVPSPSTPPWRLGLSHRAVLQALTCPSACPSQSLFRGAL